MQISEEESRRRSENMRKLHAEGRAGGEFGKLGGRPSKKKVLAQKVAEELEGEAENIATRIKDIIAEGGDRVAIDAIRVAHQYTETARVIEKEEVNELERLDRNELIATGVEALIGLLGDRRGEASVFDISVDSVEEEGPAELGPGTSGGDEAEEADWSAN